MGCCASLGVAPPIFQPSMNRVAGGWNLSQLTLGGMRGTPWTGHRSVIGLTSKQKTHMHCYGQVGVVSQTRPKDMQVRLTGDSKLPVCVNVGGCLSVCRPCDGLVTCPGCVPPLAQCQLKLASGPCSTWVFLCNSLYTEIECFQKDFHSY